jgi:hypothetical protein
MLKAVQYPIILSEYLRGLLRRPLTILQIIIIERINEISGENKNIKTCSAFWTKLAQKL